MIQKPMRQHRQLKDSDDSPPHGHGHGHGHGHAHSGVRGFFHQLFAPHSHDVSDSIDDALKSSSQGIRAVKISLAGLGATATFQLFVFMASGSVALLADTVHNFSDALTSVPLWIAFLLGRKAATRRYNYGFGRAEDLAGLFIVAMIALSAIIAAVESVRRIFQPQPIENLGWVLAAALIGFAGNELVAVYRIRVGRRIGSAALIADGVHARTDGFTSLAVVAGVVGIWLGFPLADPLVGLLISIAITVLLFGTARDVGRRLMDGVDPDLVARAEESITPYTPGGTTVKMRWSGHKLHILITCPVDDTNTIRQIKNLSEEVTNALRKDIPHTGEVLLVPAR